MLTFNARTLTYLVIALIVLSVGLGGTVVLAADPTPTATTQAPQNSQAPVATATVVVTPTATATKAPATATATKVPATNTPVPPGPAQVPPTATATKVPPTATKAAPTATKTVTPTVVAPTATKTVTPTVATATATKTATPKPTATVAARLGPRIGSVTALSTSFVVQNLDQGTNADVTATFYNGLGSTVGSGVTCNGVLPNKNCLVDQRVTGGGLDGQTNWQGSVVLSSNTELAAVVNEYGGNSGSGTAFRMDTYNGIAESDGGTLVLLPQLLKDHLDPQTGLYNSTIAIQNTSLSASARVTITYTSIGLSTFIHPGIVISPSTSYVIDLHNETYLPSQNPVTQSAFYGSAYVSSDLPVGVIVNQNAPGVLNVYQGFPSVSAYTLYVPQFMHNHMDNGYAWNTSILVMTSAPTATVDVTYIQRGTGAQLHSSNTATPLYSFDARYEPTIVNSGIADYFGSVVVSSNKPIVAVVSQFTSGDSRGFRSKYFRPFASGGATSTAFFPQFLKNRLDSPTGINFGSSAVGMVLGTLPATVTNTYYFNDGTAPIVSTFTTSSSDPLFYFDSRYDSALSGKASMFASSVISSTQPIAVTGHVFGSNFSLASGDTEGSYSGLNH